MGRPSHQDDREGADLELAQEAEQFRDRVEQGEKPGAHKPKRRRPYREAQESGLNKSETPLDETAPKKLGDKLNWIRKQHS
jgi:hypothetical protein